jgi:hypothetical protein
MSSTTRDKLLEAAKTLLLKNGWEGTTGRAIHDSIGVKHGSSSPVPGLWPPIGG